MRFFEVEDRPVIWFDSDSAIVFDSKVWRTTSVSFARKVLLAGYEMPLEQFQNAFPKAAQFMPSSKCQAEVLADLRKLTPDELSKAWAIGNVLAELDAREMLAKRTREYLKKQPNRSD